MGKYIKIIGIIADVMHYVLKLPLKKAVEIYSIFFICAVTIALKN